MSFPCPVCDNVMGRPAKDYNICSQCGTEFGYDAEENYPALRQQWIDSGKKHWYTEKVKQGERTRILIEFTGLAAVWREANYLMVNRGCARSLENKIKELQKE